MEQRFDPTKHMTKVQGGADYLEVKWRLVWVHEKHPNVSIQTEVVRLDDTGVLIRAEVTIPREDGLASTYSGYSWGAMGTRFPPIETTETSAVGRALAHAGIGTQFAGRDVVERDDGFLADSPVQRQNAPQARQRPDNRRYPQAADAALADAQESAQAATEPDYGHATEKQAKFISALVKDLEWTRADVERYLDNTYGVKRISELGSRQDVSAFIEHLQGIKAENEPS